jgi:hypothetical protein
VVQQNESTSLKKLEILVAHLACFTNYEAINQKVKLAAKNTNRIMRSTVRQNG